MTLDKEDLATLKILLQSEVKNTVDVALVPVKRSLTAIEGRLLALEKDVKEIYRMV